MRKRRIEIEFRSRFNKGKYNSLSRILRNKAKDLGIDDKDVYFFILPDKLVKVVNEFSKKSAKIVVKLNKIGRGSDFEELEIPIFPRHVSAIVRFLKLLRITNNIMHNFQKRHNYLYRGVEVALKYSSVWGYHAEFEVLVNRKKDKKFAESKIGGVARELGVGLMSDKELRKFTKNAERKNAVRYSK